MFIKKTQLQIYNELFFKYYPANEMVDKYSSSIRVFKDEIIDGPIIDIGCGFSWDLIYLANLDRKFYAVDKDQHSLDLLKRKIEEKEGSNIDNWSFLPLTFLQDKLPHEKYALVILSNFLHFFEEDKFLHIRYILDQITIPGSMIYTLCHSINHESCKEPITDYFKSFYEPSTFDKIFPPDKYEKILVVEREGKESKKDINILYETLEILCKQEGYSDDKIRVIQNLNLDPNKNTIANIEVLFRKK